LRNGFELVLRGGHLCSNCRYKLRLYPLVITLMKTRSNQSGFTLIELMVGLVITLIFLTAGANSVMNWHYRRAVTQAKGDLIAAYSMAKAMALRNPNAVTSGSSAGILLVPASGAADHTLYVCAGDPSVIASCGPGASASAVLTSRTLPAAMAVSVAASALLSSNLVLTLDGTGQPTTGVAYTYGLSLGSEILSNLVTENGTLY